ncbi:MAG: cytochrome c oxidase assembly protein [Acidimicrobiia bacterium]
MAAAEVGDVTAWHSHLDVFGVVIALVVAYEYGLRTLRARYAPRGEPAITRSRRFAYYAGVGLLFIVSSWPIHDIGDRSLFLFHMVEHLTIALAVPPLLIWGTPWWLLRALLRPVLPVLEILTKPFVALFVFNAVLGLLHVPAVVELMLTSGLFHFALHAALFVTAVLMWFPVLNPIPDLPRLAPFPKMGYLFLQSLVPTIPASFLTLGDTALYPIYETFPRLWGISPHTDQVLAGLVMKIGGGLALWSAIAAVFFRWYAEEQRVDRPTVGEPQR